MSRKKQTIRKLFISSIMAIFIVAPAMAMNDFGVIETETGFYYVVQKGDTLWGLSQKFNNSPWIWPDLWKNNDQKITNPHWIFPGQRIQVYKRSDSQVVASNAPVIGFPESSPEENFLTYSAIEKVGFIRNPPIVPVGHIGNVQTEKNLISEGDIVYVQPTADTDDPFISGSRYTLFRYLQPTEDKSSIRTIGTQHYIVGLVEVTRKDMDTITAKVVKSFRPIQTGDLLMPDTDKDEKILILPGNPDIEGQIITTEEQSALIGDYATVFIDKGNVDNIKPGQEYVLFREQPLDRNRVAPPMQVGKFIVLHTEETTATALITAASVDLARGERFRASLQQ